MKYIKNFNNHKINESLGVADPTLCFVDAIKSIIYDKLLEFIYTEYTIGEKEIYHIVIPFNEIRKFVKNWKLYPYFPISEIVIDLDMVVNSSEEVKGFGIEKDKTPFLMGASATPFTSKGAKTSTRIKNPVRLNDDHSISVQIGISAKFSSEFSEENENGLETKLESVILHELNHLYEFYYRKMNKGGDIEYSLTWLSIGDNRYRRPKELFTYWQDYFTYYIYMSEPHEIRAFTQELKAYVDRLDFKSLKETYNYRLIKAMQNFDYKSFVNGFNKVIHKHNPEYVNVIIDTLINDFKKEYKRLSLYEEKNIISPEKISRLNRTEFFEFWQKHIRKAGDTLARRVGRLYSYKKSKEESNLL